MAMVHLEPLDDASRLVDWSQPTPVTTIDENVPADWKSQVTQNVEGTFHRLCPHEAEAAR